MQVALCLAMECLHSDPSWQAVDRWSRIRSNLYFHSYIDSALLRVGLNAALTFLLLSLLLQDFSFRLGASWKTYEQCFNPKFHLCKVDKSSWNPENFSKSWKLWDVVERDMLLTCNTKKVWFQQVYQIFPYQLPSSYICGFCCCYVFKLDLSLQAV